MWEPNNKQSQQQGYGVPPSSVPAYPAEANVQQQAYNMPPYSAPPYQAGGQQQVYNVPSSSGPPYPAGVQVQQVYNVPPSSVPNYPPVVQVQVQNQGWNNRNNHRPQTSSVAAAGVLFMSGGMNMAWNLGFAIVAPTDLILSWFIAAIVGAVIGAFICNLTQKKFITCFASLLVIISGILQISNPNSYDATMASRSINGIAVGLVFPLVFVLVGEEIVKSKRGYAAVSIDIQYFSCGIFIQTIFIFFWPNDMQQSFSVTQMFGVFNILIGGMGLVMSVMLLIESPLFYLVRDQEQAAVDTLRRLHKPSIITQETYELLEEHKRYLAESRESNFLKSAIVGLPALVKLCFYRMFMALTFSFYINYAFTYSSLVTGQYGDLSWAFCLYGIARYVGALIALFLVDSRGRKSCMIVGFIICCIIAFTVGGIFDDKRNLITYSYMNAVKYMLIIYQLIAPISMASSSAYLSEAFPLAVKPYYIAIVFIVEMVVHIIIVCTRAIPSVFNIFDMPDYFFTLGSLSLVFAFVAVFLMPETKFDTLRECLTKFRKLINFRS